MSNNEKDDSRRSRWVWEKDDIIIIKKSDLQPEKAAEQAESKPDADAADDNAQGVISDQSDKSSER